MSPSPNALWLVAGHLESANPVEQLHDLREALGHGKLGTAALIDFPEFKTGTLSSLLTLSEQLAEHDQNVASVLQKTVDTIRSLTAEPSGPTAAIPHAENRASPLSQHLVLDDGRPYLAYLLPDEDQPVGTESDDRWEWNRAKYRTEDRPLPDIVDALVKEVGSIENAQRNKTQQYQLIKGQLTNALRKKTGNLSMRSLNDVVSASDFAATNHSEYLETALVAVPKNSVKEWDSTYERLTQMVVPRSSTKLAEDDEYVLFSVTLFRRVKDEFAQKAREKKFIVRDFTYDEGEIEQQRKDVENLLIEEQEMWADMLRLSRINFSELFQVLVHLKIVRAYVESVLRYGLPAAYFGAAIKPDPRQADKLVSTLSSFLVPSKGDGKKKGKKPSASGGDDSAALGEYASVMEGEYYDFVLFELERVEQKGE
ncbi:hypothetical protein JCM8202_000235 [Rhodotorula sphaerocarpa]